MNKYVSSLPKHVKSYIGATGVEISPFGDFMIPGERIRGSLPPDYSDLTR